MRMRFAALVGGGAFLGCLLLSLLGFAQGYVLPVLIGLGGAVAGWLVWPSLNKNRES